jgi:hypothetical protein
VIPNGHYSSELNFSAYICEKIDHRLIVIFSGQIVRYVLSFMKYIYEYIYADMYNVSQVSKKVKNTAIPVTGHGGL